ncbi:MAG: N-acetylneuraminate synthase [Candidatus Rifleibacteriota bacterium]
MYLDRFKQKPVIIAEAGVNHNGSPDLARKLIEAAAASGADIVKFQTFKAYECASFGCQKTNYQKHTAATDQFELLEQLELPFERFKELKQYAESLGLEFLSTPDGHESLDCLCDIGINAIKIASGEVTNLPFLVEISRKCLPVILSTGMSSIGEVEQAINTLRKNGAHDLMLLHCTSEYPTPPSDINLSVIHTLKQAFSLPTGLSDHSQGIEAAIAATALGAQIIEKHFTLDKTLPGPDHAASLEPDELKQLVSSVRKTARMIGYPGKIPAPSEKENINLVRRSIVANQKIKKGQCIIEAMLTTKRPASGIEPKFWQQVLYRETLFDIEPDQPLTWEMLGKVKKIEN